MVNFGDGVFMKLSTESSENNEQTIALQIIDTDLKEYSQKVIVKNIEGQYTFEYKDDFDQQERIKKEVDVLKEISRKEKEEERLNQERIASEKDEARYRDDEIKIVALLKKKQLLQIDGLKSKINEPEYIKTLKNKTSRVTASNMLFLTNDNELVNYQIQKRDAGTGDLVDTSVEKQERLIRKEKTITTQQVQEILNQLNRVTGYSGIGSVGSDRTVEVKFSGKTKYILLSDINKILAKYEMKI